MGKRFRITHPFHPLRGIAFECCGTFRGAGGPILLFRDGDGQLRHVPPKWTDWLPEDPALILTGRRYPALLPDLIRLAELVSTLRSAPPHHRRRQASQKSGNGNSATSVNANPQQVTPLPVRNGSDLTTDTGMMRAGRRHK